MSERLCAWGVIHNSHGTHVDRVCFLPEGEKPGADIAWVRLPWLDENGAAIVVPDEGSGSTRRVFLSCSEVETLKWLVKHVNATTMPGVRPRADKARALAVLDRLLGGGR